MNSFAGEPLHDDQARPHPEHDSDPIRLADLFRALADPTRLVIIRIIAHDEQRVVDLTRRLGLAQSTVSAHLGVLREIGLVVARAQGRSMFYRIRDPEIDRLLLEADHVLERISPDISADDTMKQEEEQK